MKVKVFCDFDGTITLKDSGDLFFQTFSRFEPFHTDLLEGRINVRQYYDSVVSELPFPINENQLQTFIDSLEIDPYIVKFFQFCKENEIAVTIVSDGFGFYISKILEKYSIVVPVISNKILILETGYKAVFPYSTEGCKCFSASCKRNAILSNISSDDLVVYIGDGRSDYCPVQFADVVFAKGMLDVYCAQNHISYFPFKSFFDIQRLLALYLKKNVKKTKHSNYIQRMAIFLQE